MSRRRALALFSIGLLVAAALAEVSARIAEAAGPTALRWYDTSTQLKVEQMDQLGETNVVFAGTSMVWQGLVPASFKEADPDHRTAYNAGLAGGVPVVMEPWLLEEVTPRLDPDLVIWGLSSMDFSSSYGDDNLSRFRDALEGRTGTFASVEQTAARYSALVRYRSILRRPTALFGTGKAQIEQDFSEAAAVLGDSGERRDFAVDTGPERSRQVQARLRPYRIDPTDIDAIERTAAALRDRGIDVVFVEIPDAGKSVDKGDEVAVVESVKAASEIYAPISGQVTEGNADLEDAPATINSNAEGDGWIFKMTVSDASELDEMMDAAAYATHVAGLE